MIVSKWGNSLAVRLPAKLVSELGLKEGDEIEVRAMEGCLEIAQARDREDRLRSLRDLRGAVPADYKFSREDAYPSKRGGRDLDD